MGDDLTATVRVRFIHTGTVALYQDEIIRKNNGFINLNAFFTGKTAAWQGLIAFGNFPLGQMERVLTTVI